MLRAICGAAQWQRLPDRCHRRCRCRLDRSGTHARLGRKCQHRRGGWLKRKRRRCKSSFCADQRNAAARRCPAAMRPACRNHASPGRRGGGKRTARPDRPGDAARWRL